MDAMRICAILWEGLWLVWLIAWLRTKPTQERAGFGFRILPAGWMRGLLFTATAVLTVVLALFDLISAWVLLVFFVSVVLAVVYLETFDRITRPSTPPD